MVRSVDNTYRTSHPGMFPGLYNQNRDHNRQIHQLFEGKIKDINIENTDVNINILQIAYSSNKMLLILTCFADLSCAFMEGSYIIIVEINSTIRHPQIAASWESNPLSCCFHCHKFRSWYLLPDFIYSFPALIFSIHLRKRFRLHQIAK